ncbi:MAG TPA: alpha-glucan family phosphorylase [Bacteroidota bacterium]|nr:alpha-glucan family phosphorylase [Bacteroidota bacterium]
MPKKKYTTDQLIGRIRELAYNLWWSWNPRAQQIFEDLSPLTWEETKHNPVAVLSQVSETELRVYLNDRDFLEMVLPVLDDFDRYMARKSTFASRRGTKKGRPRGPVAYFCAEFGLHECLNFYSGGLGILAGDHVKSASDLGLPLVAVGLFYRRGYFEQKIDGAGQQLEEYPTVDPSLIPVRSVRDASGKPVVCRITIGEEDVFFETWRIDVGKSTIYLLDTDVPENSEQARGLTSLAYGGDMNMRIRQEIVLGIGGVKLLRALGFSPAVYHMNEGHAAFLTLELLREEMLRTGDLAASESSVRSRCVFTTHTPVPAGHDRFPRELMESTLKSQCAEIGIDTERMMSYGTAGPGKENHEFTMTVLGLKFSRAANGVSKKHGEISAIMWKDLYPDRSHWKPVIGHITNGIHIPTWTSRRSWEFWERHNSHRWKDEVHHPRFWEHLTDPKTVSDEELWSLRYTLRRDLIEFVRRRAQQRRVIGGPTGKEALYNLLSYDTLTIGFARRFAPYKRAPLLFSEIEKAIALFNDPARPIQLIYAGKAHPRDGGGKDFIRQITQLCDHPTLHGRIVFLEDYDINVARYLVSGCDVWLNTPRRPLEASGTSGQKIAINGGLHLSILDGWWIEGYNRKNGWAIGGIDPIPRSNEEADAADAVSLYDVLGKEVIPLFYSRDRSGIPRKWIAMIRTSLRTLIPVFNTHRMVSEYAEKYYFPE